MNRLDKLIFEKSPNGVAFVRIAELAKIETGNLNANKAEEQGQFHFFTCSDKISRTSTFRWDNEAIMISGNGYLGVTHYFVGKFNAYQRTYVLTQFRNVEAKFLHYVLKAKFRDHAISNAKQGSVPYIVLATIADFRIPVPPLEVQQEIVRILDTFTELEAELEAELEGRKKQYEHYRNTLLSFPDGNVRRVPLGEFAELIRGNGLPKADFTESGVPAIHYGQIYTHYKTWATETKSFVAETTSTKLAKVLPGDLVITNTSENLEDVGKAVAWLGSRTAVTGGHATVIRHKQNPKYLAYYFQTSQFSIDKAKHARGTKVIDVSAKDLAKISVPLPAIEEQDQIVKILDGFELLTWSLSEGLPAEIEARRKQYEHYRAKLLTFKELAA